MKWNGNSAYSPKVFFDDRSMHRSALIELVKRLKGTVKCVKSTVLFDHSTRSLAQFVKLRLIEYRMESNTFDPLCDCYIYIGNIDQIGKI